MAAQWPRVKAQLLAVLPTLSGWSDVDLYNGPPVGDGVADQWVTVGYVPGNVSAGIYSWAQNLDGYQYDETGQVLGQLSCTSGDDELDTVEATAFGLMNTFEGWVRSDRTLGGVLSQEGTAALTVEPLPYAQGVGAAVELNWTLTYTTVT